MMQTQFIMTTFNKYDLYERSVQSPEIHARWFKSMYRELRKGEARHLREDFCGTFQLSCEWVKNDESHTSLCIDLDSEPLVYGKKSHLSLLTTHQKQRIKPLRSNVLHPTPPRFDLIIGCNFSFFIFKERQILLKYFKSCLKSLNSRGMLILEVAGGPGMINAVEEKKFVPLPDSTRGKKKFEYTWHQKSFNPISRNAHYGIHFKLPNGKTLKNCFTYDWRLWTLPELRDLLAEAGFKKSKVYWETEYKGKGTGEFVQTEEGDNAFAWVAYLVGLK